MRRVASGPAEAALDEGDELFRAKRFDEAARCYTHALGLLEGRGGELLVETFLRLGRVHQARSRVTACLHCFKKALQVDPSHVPTLRALADLHLEWRELEAAAAVERRLFAAVTGDEARALELIRSGDRWWKRARSPEHAKQRYRRALAFTGHHERATARLRAVSNTTTQDELAALEARAHHTADDAERARALFELGVATWIEAHDRDKAIRAFEAAFVADRSLTAAVDMLIAALVEHGDYVKLETMAAALAEASDAPSVTARGKLRQALRALPEGVLRTQSARRRTLSWARRRAG